MSEIIIHQRSSSAMVHRLSNDLLDEIFRRLPPEPICLLRASLVCKRWCGVLHDDRFISRFRDYHTPPILGFFCSINLFSSYIPTTAGPRFSLPSNHPWQVLHCRHGHVLFFDLCMRKLLVWNPIVGEELYMPMPPEFEGGFFNATVLCTSCHNHHGDCHASSFHVVFVSMEDGALFISAYVYSSETGQWCDATSISSPYCIDMKPPALVGDNLYWSLDQNNILEFDLEKRSLARSKVPWEIFLYKYKGEIQLMLGEDGRLVFAGVQRSSIHLWSRETDSSGAPTWLLRRKITDVHNLFLMQRAMMSEDLVIEIVGIAENGNVIFVRTVYGIFMVQLKSMQFKKVFEGRKNFDVFPYTNFYISGGGIIGGGHGAEVLNNI